MNLIRRRDPEPRLGPDRRWKILPAPGPHENPFHGAQILEEVGGPLGLLLWQRVRDVVLWSRFLPLGGGGLFIDAPAAPMRGVEPALAQALEGLRRVVEDGERVTGETVAAACSAVHEWALDRSCFWTAAYYAEAAAAARPMDPMLAVYAGRVARTQRQFPRASQWFKRAIGVARRSERWDVYVVALLGLGKLEQMLRRIPQARRYLIAALKTATEYRLWSLGAEARHDLMVLEFDTGRVQQATEHAAAAHQLYPTDAPNIPTLAHDWAYIWASQGYHAVALPVFEVALPYIAGTGGRVLALSSIAWTAAATGDGRRYQMAKEALLPFSSDQTATAMVNVARGALVIEGVPEAKALAGRARDLARGRDEPVVVHMAEDFLAHIRAGAHRAATVTAPPDPTIEQTATMLITRIRQGAAGFSIR